MQCPVCSSTRLSPETDTGPYNTSFRSEFEAGGKLLITQITRGRICGDCGYILLFASEDQLSKLQQQWNELMSHER
jgi:hypothetical protein